MPKSRWWFAISLAPFIAGAAPPEGNPRAPTEDLRARCDELMNGSEY